MSDFEETLLDYMKRITLALEQIARKGEKCPHGTFGGSEHCMKCRPELMEGEKSVEPALKENVQHSINTGTISTDSKPSFINTSSLAQREAHLEKTTVVETQNFVDVRECKDYSDKAYKLIGYDNLETYIAKQHVIRTESIEGGGTRVVVSQKSAWAITKLEWK